jgi:hypothetical protein
VAAREGGEAGLQRALSGVVRAVGHQAGKNALLIRRHGAGGQDWLLLHRALLRLGRLAYVTRAPGSGQSPFTSRAVTRRHCL